MSNPFLGEIRAMSFNFAPKGWAFCNGQLLPINQNQALFSLLGTTFGGNGQTTFALPDLRGRVPMHVGNGHSLGERAGAATETLSINQLPAHTHVVGAVGAATGGNAVPTGRYLGGANNAYHAPGASTTLIPDTISNKGGSQPHENRQPFSTISMCIALQGIFPARN